MILLDLDRDAIESETATMPKTKVDAGQVESMLDLGIGVAVRTLEEKDSDTLDVKNNAGREDSHCIGAYDQEDANNFLCRVSSNRSLAMPPTSSKPCNWNRPQPY